ncbi:MAG TPA: S16 family serine protease, partial [Dehalococcoidia bacterium]|nr:S16 family serine protease [Dehalococcoidia bacterium]
YLGPQQYFWGMAEEQDQIGVATGVARTEMGGDVLSVEVTLMPGKGNLILTGQLGEVMRESAQAALSYARSSAAQLGITLGDVEKQDIHVHVPAGGVPKDGPSAGVTIATSLISALAQRRVNRHVAMTGEITLRGRVLPVGGIKEKVLAAHRAGIKTFVLPTKNRKDLVEVPEGVRRSLQFVYAEEMDEVLRTAFPDWNAMRLRQAQKLARVDSSRLKQSSPRPGSAPPSSRVPSARPGDPRPAPPA